LIRACRSPSDRATTAPDACQPEFLIRTFATGGATHGQCEVIYWACGKKGQSIEPVGQVSTDQLEGLTLDGPTRREFGRHTHLAPAFDHLVQGTPAESSGVLYFVTDGRIDDEHDVVDRTPEL
jgi:hypothetical protein